MMMKEVGDVQKKQDAQQQHWSIYNDSLTYISSWLDNMEAGVSQDQVSKTQRVILYILDNKTENFSFNYIILFLKTKIKLIHKEKLLIQKIS